ncbi:Ornithine decarboxylase [Trichinella pseudospiralis]|uniref:Ornithine decarboxylase n=1 Tax=Trichinella pseudospiralis TaxID=6337 RepID=A0A0V1EA35_TRIPS|nr:Ornithine decarboxylase [Trichinella pseudospiralis]KRZ20244.1 Ornithine decarboxylase [Trichinella pseudospiralis]KRZ39158.1 Ornithine decarboxylase [Trichinella pseudospiralis]
MKIIKYNASEELFSSFRCLASASFLQNFDVEIVENCSTYKELATLAKADGVTAQDNGRLVCFFDIGQLFHQHKLWLKCLPRVKPFYSVRCNGNEALLQILNRLGLSFECKSKARAEIESVLKVGVSPEEILYANPCKTAKHIQHAMMCSVRKIVFDNEDELYKVKRLFPTAELILRINVSDPTIAVLPHNLNFGCDPEIEGPSLLILALLLDLKVIGISFHVGSNCDDGTLYAKAIAQSRRLFDYAAGLGHKMRLLDIGGGFPGQNAAKFQTIAEAVNCSLEEHFPIDSGVDVLAEPGRFYAEKAFTLCCTVIARRTVPANQITKSEADRNLFGFTYYINDGVYGSFSCILCDTGKPVASVLKEGSEKLYWTSVCGPTDDSLDLVIAQCRMPMLGEGDVIMFENMGAYTFNSDSVCKPEMRYVISRNDWQVFAFLSKFMGNHETAELNSHADNLCAKLFA